LDKESVKELLKEYKTGNHVALEQLMRLTYKNLYSLAYSYLKDHQLSEDVVSDAFLKIIEKIHTIKSEQNLNGYLRTIVINRALDVIRKRKKEISVDDKVIEIQPANTLTSSDSKRVRMVLAELKTVEREILMLWQYDYTLREISNKTDLTINQVRLLLQKAKENFFKKYHKSMVDETL